MTNLQSLIMTFVWRLSLAHSGWCGQGKAAILPEMRP